MLCQRFERRMRQCGAFELRISTRVARPNPIKLTETCPAVIKSLDNEHQKIYLRVGALNVRAHFKKANSAMTVLFFVVNEVRLHSAIGYVTPKTKLEGKEKEVFQERDRKLEAAREERRSKRAESQRAIA